MVRDSIRTSASRAPHPGGTRLELLVLPGLGAIAAAEAADVLRPLGTVRPVPGRDDSITCEVRSTLDARRLRTVVAAFRVLDFPVPRPKSLTSPEHLRVIARAVREAAGIEPMATFRVDAAGADSPVFRRLIAGLADATGLVPDPVGGECLLRVRRAPAAFGWQVLVRLSPRPLSARPWRVARFPGALNATLAAAAVRLTRPRSGDRVLNLMCGSGTQLIERLLARGAAEAVAVDRDPVALSACERNLAAAGLLSDVDLVRADIADGGKYGGGEFDVIFADPPWGDKVAIGGDALDMHRLLLDRAHELGAPGARLAVVTHRVKAMDRALSERRDRWRAVEHVRVWAKGHHPRVHVLRRVQRARKSW